MLLKDGYKPRIKKAKGKEYISLRRERGEKELSLGRKTEPLWSFIQANIPKGDIEDLKTRLQELENNMITSLKDNHDTVAKLAADIKEIKKKQSKCKNDISNISTSVKFLISSAERRVRDDANGCVHLGQDGYCTLWYYGNRQWDRDQKEDVSNGKTCYRDNVKKNPEICASCPSFKSKGDKN